MKKRGATEARARVSVVVRAVLPHSSRLQPPAVTMGPSAGATGSCGGQGLREVFSLQLLLTGNSRVTMCLEATRSTAAPLQVVTKTLRVLPFLRGSNNLHLFGHRMLV